MLAKGGLAALLIACNGPLHAETLKEALTAAYLFNPTLKAAQAQLRSTDNNVSLAKSGYRPTIGSTLQYGYENQKTTITNLTSSTGSYAICPGAVNPNGSCVLASGQSATANPLNSTASTVTSGSGTPRSAEFNIQQNIFNGFQTYNNVKGAEAGVEAGRESLRAAEESVLLSSATAYMNVVRDQAIVDLRKNNVKVLAEQLRATEDRFKVGEVTKTDLAQAQSGLAQGQADLSIAQGTLYGDQAVFAQFVGHPPRALKDPGAPERLLPKTLEAAVGVARVENPNILGAIFQERAQQHAVEQLKGQLLPSLSANASYTNAAQPFGAPETTQEQDTLVFGQLNVPIYQAGAVSAQIRQATESLSQARQQIDVQRELARSNATSQWGLIVAARGNIAAGKTAVESTKVSLEGVREEERVGQRTILDVLNAEQQNLTAQVNLVSFQHDLVVASYGLLSAMGRLTAYDIALAAEFYDPTRYYGQVKDAFYGWGPSVESGEDPRVAPVIEPGRTPDQKSTDGPAYTQNLPQIP